MSIILAIDSSNAHCSVALNCDGSIIQRVSEQPRQHARRVLPMIAELLAEKSLAPTDIDAIAIVSGPGSFTGLRIGAGVAQGLAFGVGVPVVGVSALEIIAMKAHYNEGYTHLLVCMRAREDEVYSAAYCVCGEQITLQGREMVGAPQERHFEGADGTAKWFGVGDGWSYAQALNAKTGLQVLGSNASEMSSDAATLSVLASMKWAKHGGVAPELALPVYLKEQMDYQE